MNPEQIQQLNQSIAAINQASTALGKEKGVQLQQLTPLSMPQQGQQIVSSSDPLINKQKEQAVNTAANNLVASPYQDVTNMLQDMTNQQRGEITQMREQTLAAQQLVYDSALAQQNLQYDRLARNLQQDYQKNIQVAKQSAISLNPYSQARQASTARNFEGEITNQYNQAAAELQRQADVAQQALAAGQYQAYVQIMNDATRSQQELTNRMFNYMNDMVKQAEQTRQFEQTFSFQQEQFNTNNYFNAINRLSVPELSDLNKMTPQEFLSLPAVQAGLNAGFSIQGILQDITGAAKLKGINIDEANLNRTYKELQISKLRNDINNQGDKGVSPLLTALFTGGFSEEEGKKVLASLVATGDLNATSAKFIGENIGIFETKEQQALSSKLTPVLNNFSQLVSILDEIPAGLGVAPEFALSKVPFVPKTETAASIAGYNALRQSFIGPVARVISQEVGVLTDKDVKRAQDVLPSIYDDLKTRNEKIKNFEQAVNNIISGQAKSDEAKRWVKEQQDTTVQVDLSDLNFSFN